MVTSRVGPYVLSAGSTWPPDESRPVDARAPDGRQVVLGRAARPEGGHRGAGIAFAAGLASSSHVHLPHLLDVLVDAGGDVVHVTAGPRRERLDDWVRRRGTMTAGEAVTLVLPVLAAVGHLARRGTALSGVGLGDVELDDRGAPVLVGGTVAVARGARDSLAEAAAGARAFVLAVAGELAPHDSESLRACAVGGARPADLDELAEKVHDLAPPAPLPTAAPRPGVGEEPEVAWRPPPSTDPPRPGWAAVLPESAVVDSLVAWWADRGPTTVGESLRSVRPRYWLLGGLVAVSLVVGLGVASTPGDDGHPSPGPPESTGETDVGTVVPTAPGPDAVPGSGAPDSEAPAAIQGDDVLAATTVLLDARVACLREPTRSCLAAVDQVGSPIGAQDAVTLDDPASTAGLVLPVTVEAELQRLGESVLVACLTADDEPASVLVVRTEAGWRLREVVRR